jgi:hypothetical protein
MIPKIHHELSAVKAFSEFKRVKKSISSWCDFFKVYLTLGQYFV